MKSVTWISSTVLGVLAIVSAFTALNVQAHDNNWSVGVVVGNPYPPPVTYYAAPPVYYGPPPVTIYRHPQSTRFYGPSAYGQPIYAAPIVSYPQVIPGGVQFSYGNQNGYGYHNYDRGPRGYGNGWGGNHWRGNGWGGNGRGRDGDHDGHHHR